MSIDRYSSTWMHARENIVERACASIERQRARGVAVRRAAGRIAQRWNGRENRAEPSRRIRLARGTLVEIYYRWIKSGKSADAFRLHYKSAGRKIPAMLVAAFVRACMLPEIDSLNGGFRKLQSLWIAGEVKRPFKFRRSDKLPFSAQTYQRALSDEQRYALIDFQKTRAKAGHAHKRLLTIFQT